MDQAKVGPLRAGDTFLGKYEIRSLLGKGGHAFVYEAYDPFLDRSVAIKVVKSPKDAGRDLGKRARSEAQVLSRVDHKNLVKVLDAGIADGLVYLIMEKLVGRTLRDALRDLQRLSVAEALTVGLQVAEGMEVAHREQVVHRDLKPENIFIEAGNALKVLDFGIAKVLGMAGHPDTTQKDLLQGTVLYMSPEHLQGISVTPRSDVYALGTILFEALYAHPLSIGEKPAGLQEAAWMQIAKVPPMLDELDATIPRFISRVIHRAIVKIPDQRYQSMRELRDALELAVTRLKAERANHPTQQSLRDLSVTAPPAAQPLLPRDTVRAEPVLTSQVTVAAPRHDRGDTEPVSRLPFTLSPDQVPHPRDDRTPLIYGTVAPSPQPAPFNQAGAVPHTLRLIENQAGHASHAMPPGTAAAPRASAPPAVTPSTAPPVSRGLTPQPVRLPTPLLKDRGVRLAVVSAIVVGVGGGTAFGFLAPRTNAESLASAASSSLAPPPVLEPVAAAPTVSPAENVPPPPPPSSAVPNLEAEARKKATPTPRATVTAPRPVAARGNTFGEVDSGLGADPAPAPRAAKATSSVKPPAPRAPAAASDLQQRLDWLDRDTKPKTPPSSKGGQL